MDPTDVGAILGAVLSGVTGEAGKQAWQSLTQLLRRFNSPIELPNRMPLSELDIRRRDGVVSELAADLSKIADRDAAFRQGLAEWLAEWRDLPTSTSSTTHNTVSGGTQYGPVIQAQRIDGGIWLR